MTSPDPADRDRDVFAVHEGGKLTVSSRSPIESIEDLALTYTPGVATVCLAIAADPRLARRYTWVSRLVAVVSDGTAVLGLGNLGPVASLPVMEGKVCLFTELAGLSAVPIILDTTDVNEIIETVVRIAPSFGGINLEDISAPSCFEIERRLKERLSIPVMHTTTNTERRSSYSRPCGMRQGSPAGSSASCEWPSSAQALRGSRARRSCWRPE